MGAGDNDCRSDAVTRTGDDSIGFLTGTAPASRRIRTIALVQTFVLTGK
jgi:hypothetical protein